MEHFFLKTSYQVPFPQVVGKTAGFPGPAAGVALSHPPGPLPSASTLRPCPRPLRLTLPDAPRDARVLRPRGCGSRSAWPCAAHPCLPLAQVSAPTHQTLHARACAAASPESPPPVPCFILLLFKQTYFYLFVCFVLFCKQLEEQGRVEWKAQRFPLCPLFPPRPIRTRARRLSQSVNLHCLSMVTICAAK